MTSRITRRALTAGILAATAAPAAAYNAGSAGIALRGDDTARLPDHAAFWARLPLPFSLAEAWHKLSPATQAEIGGAVLGMALANYVYGDGRADADQFTDKALRSAAYDVADNLLNRIDDRLWVLLPDLYGPEGDHPRWAYDGGMVYPLGIVLPEAAPAVIADEPDPVLAAIEEREAASRHLSRVSAETADDESAEANAIWSACDRRVAAADDTLRTTAPTTLAGIAALAQHYAGMSTDPNGEGLTHLVEALTGFVS